METAARPNSPEAKDPKNPRTTPAGFRRFLAFFRGYMSLGALAVAALPIPVARLRLIPTYAAHKGLLTVYTSLFCFLLVAFAFYSRRSFAQLFFRAQNSKTKRRVIALLPLAFICLCVVFLFAYQYTLQQSATKYRRDLMVQKWQLIFDEYSRAMAAKPERPTLQESQDLMQKLINEVHLLETGRSMEEELKYTPLENIPYNLTLLGLYLGFFLSAEAAFVVMALREYLQELRGVSDAELYAASKTAGA